jgi:5-methylcytosine-specific restriction endonuclease McrA
MNEPINDNQEWNIGQFNKNRPGNLYSNRKGRSRVVQEVKEKADFTCQICGLKDPEIIEVDHILSKGVAPHLEYDVSNLMCICPNCHVRKTKKERKVKEAYVRN